MRRRRLIPLAIWCAVAFAGCAEEGTARTEGEVSQSALRATVDFLAALDPPRNHHHPESLRRAADYIARSLADAGLTPVEQPFVVDGHPYLNVLATVGPRTGPRLIVGAHYDVSGDTPGADDNASAVAGLLELARLAARHQAELPYGVDFVAYALEEPPYFRTANMGSRIHAESLRASNTPVRGMIALEMIGYYSDRQGSQRYPLSLLRLIYPDRGNFIAVIGNFGSSGLVIEVAGSMRAAAIPVRTLRGPTSIRGVDFSDHLNYWALGYDAVMVTDTAFYRNPHYHRPTDTAGTLSFELMAEVVWGVWLAILTMH